MSMFKRVARVVTLLEILILGVFIDGTASLDLKFQQNDYRIEFERFELVRFTKSYMKSYKVTTFKYNRTCPLVNATFEYNFEIGNELEIITQAYMFLSNEYRYFPLRLEINYCEGVKKNYIGLGDSTKCGNFTGCPIKKGQVYHYCNWAPDQWRFPPFIPDGRYKLELQGVYHDTEMFLMNAYGKVYRPIWGNY